MLVTAFFAVSFFLIQDIVEAGMRKYNTISPMLTVTKLNTGHPIVLDVREPGEYSKGHITDAINIPVANIEAQVNKIDLYKRDDVIVVCQTGTRSAPACATLKKLGFENIFLMTGGMQSWEENKLPIVKSKK
ncbi:rhodanese-like domain-containing protein [Bathymodiolus japonicus methanotrophic gill symbiont]|uniref:rhodanese-like domain-containing protein n=1 Tax=Bathymodiolus japonicus methanotrophic gill symbiont TaxID=113269 RepID=UPI001E39CC89|nr:rhodanese-like domain-containing protein [Bathymodiolus japonicus methanotrophic gill symbiont]